MVDGETDTSGIHEVDVKTRLAFITIEGNSRDNRILCYAGANSTTAPETFNKAENLGNGVHTDLVVAQLEISLGAIEQMLDTAGAAGIDVLLNLAAATRNLSERFGNVTHPVINETKAATLSGLDLQYVKDDNWNDIAKGFLLVASRTWRSRLVQTVPSLPTDRLQAAWKCSKPRS